ncbi:MAG: hypothetical protein R3B07_05095 [Polyangiaceae bacterium]
MTQPTMNCPHCGGTLALNDMTRPNCPFCGQVLPHHARAAEHQVLINRMLAQQIGAQYPGTPPDKIPQVGYGYGAGMNNLQQFQQYHVDQGFKRARNMTAIMLIGSLVFMLVIFGIVGALLLLL